MSLKLESGVIHDEMKHFPLVHPNESEVYRANEWLIPLKYSPIIGTVANGLNLTQGFNFDMCNQEEV
jgi:hypothetical protein